MKPVHFAVAHCAIAAGLLAASPAAAQSGSFVDRLLAGSTAAPPTRSINIDEPAQKRYAVVIGNGEYDAIPDLPNAVADARVMAAFLRSQDYIVHHHTNITKRGFEDVLRRILFDVDKDTEVTVFFAGHGFQIGSENYLVPTNADLDSVYDIPFEAVSLGSLVGIIGARARLQVVILDSCRDNPFAGRAAMTQLGSDLREARTGFSSQAAPLNSMLIYSTSPGAIAFDGEGENSPFTTALVNEVTEAPDALIKDVFEGVRRTVYQATNGRQIPWDSSTLVEPASFGIGAALDRPIAVNSTGMGIQRGLARISNEAPDALVLASGPAPVAVLNVEFVPEVTIGTALRNALDLSPADRVTITARPETGRLMLPRADGSLGDATGQTLLPEDVDNLVLVNESVQVPALSLENGTISDSLTVSVGGAPARIGLRLVPNQCDFHAGDHLDPGGMGITRFANEIEPETALAACQTAIEAAPETARFHYQIGRAHLSLRDTEAALAAFERAQELGHTRAWNALGNLAFTAAERSGETEQGKAPENVLSLYAHGVAEGDPYAFHSLGRQLMTFGGNDAIEVEGYDLLMRALEVGHTFSMNELAGFYLDDDSPYYDGERGLRYLRESASREDIYGYNGLGTAYYRGRGGLEVDDALAYEWYLKAANGGHPTAPYNVARMYRNGDAPSGVDFNQAVFWYEAGLDRGDALAGAKAAEIIQSEAPSQYTPFDAAVFAAKGAALTGQRDAEEARDVLSALSLRAIDGGTQQLMAALGSDVAVDGDFGPSSASALDALLASYGAGPAETDPDERIIQLAAVFWRQSAFRIDLY